jgi:hypothetical protein
MHYPPHTYVGNVLPVADDIEFWSRQLSEHALFMQLGLDDPKLKQRCAQLHQAWEHFRRGPRQIPTAITLVHHLRDLQLEVHARLARGEWLGWIWPLFVDHIRREGDYFLGALQGAKLDPVAEAQMWLTFMAEHAAFAAHLLDPNEAERIRQALDAQGKFGDLFRECASGLNDQLLSLTQRSGMDLDAYLKALGVGTPAGAKSIIHPVLAEHVVREGQRFLGTMQALQQAIQTPAPSTVS